MTTDDEYDRRFRELIAEEFHEDVPPAAPPAPSRQIHPSGFGEPPRRSAPWRRPTPPPEVEHERPFSFDDELEAADPTPDAADAFVPPTPEPWRRPRNPLMLLGAIGLSFALLMAILGLFAGGLPIMLVRFAGAVGVLGLAALLASIPRHRDPDDDGLRF